MIDHQRLDSPLRAGEVDWLLDDLVLRVGEVRHAVVLSNDGLAVGASNGLSREDAEHLAAVASGFHSLAREPDATSTPEVCDRRWSRWTKVSSSSPRRGRAPASPC